MFKIGDFSTFSQVSVKALRHYDELGLLKPARVDPATGYRYYAADQLPRLHRILALKALGFSLEQVGTLLDGELSAEQLRGMLKRRRAEIRQRLRAEESRLNEVEVRLAQIEQAETLPPYDVVMRRVEAQLVAARRQRLGDGSPTISTLFEELEALVGGYQLRAARPPLLICHDDGYHDDLRDIEVVVPITAPLPAQADVATRELDGWATMASVVHAGSYSTISQAFTAVLTWIEANGYAIAGPTREVYLRFGADQAGYDLPAAYLARSAAEFVTELQVPVAATAVS